MCFKGSIADKFDSEMDFKLIKDSDTVTIVATVITITIKIVTFGTSWVENL